MDPTVPPIRPLACLRGSIPWGPTGNGTAPPTHPNASPAEVKPGSPLLAPQFSPIQCRHTITVAVANQHYRLSAFFDGPRRCHGSTAARRPTSCSRRARVPRPPCCTSAVCQSPSWWLVVGLGSFMRLAPSCRFRLKFSEMFTPHRRIDTGEMYRRLNPIPTRMFSPLTRAHTVDPRPPESGLESSPSNPPHSPPPSCVHSDPDPGDRWRCPEPGSVASRRSHRGIRPNGRDCAHPVRRAVGDTLPSVGRTLDAPTPRGGRPG